LSAGCAMFSSQRPPDLLLDTSWTKQFSMSRSIDRGTVFEF
jgi:hypothetical protein